MTAMNMKFAKKSRKEMLNLKPNSELHYLKTRRQFDACFLSMCVFFLSLVWFPSCNLISELLLSAFQE